MIYIKARPWRSFPSLAFGALAEIRRGHADPFFKGFVKVLCVVKPVLNSDLFNTQIGGRQHILGHHDSVKNEVVVDGLPDVFANQSG